MSGKTAIVLTCGHADPDASNERFSWLGDLIEDVKPDYVIDLGDGADMRSLNSYDTRYPQAIVSQSYQKDIDSYNDAMSRLWDRYSLKKKKRPFRIGFEGNHENRIKKAVATDPRLEGERYGISFKHLNTDLWFDEYHEYHNSAPAQHSYDGIVYAHFISNGSFGRPIAGLHHAYGLVTKLHCSVTVGHSHKRSLYCKDDAYPRPSLGLVAGCFKGKDEAWAGQANREWWKGVVIKRNIEDGYYDPEFVSMDALEKAYAR